MPDEPFTAKTDESWESQMVRDWLRKPFKPEQIGKLPATSKRPALDYIGHAAVTDRLNKVAPDWTYTIDNMSTIGDTMWIRITMTIGGVSRPDFGDGKDPKEALGNAIRRAAMRYGVGLDLWSREELESASPSEGGADAGGRVDRTSSASRESSGGGQAARSDPSPLAAPPGTTSAQGEGAAIGTGGGSQTSPGVTKYPLKPEDCDHKTKTGRWLPARQVGGVPVCPRCGLSAVIYRESAA